MITLSDNLKSINITFVVTTVVVLIGVILISIKHRDKIFLHYQCTFQNIFSHILCHGIFLISPMNLHTEPFQIYYAFLKYHGQQKNHLYNDSFFIAGDDGIEPP